MISRRALLTSIAGAALAAPALRLSIPHAVKSVPSECGFNEVNAPFSLDPIKTISRTRWYRTEINLREIDLEKWVRTDPVIAAYKEMKLSES